MTLWDYPAPPVDTWPPRACEGADIGLFFAETSGSTRLAERGKRLCRRCPAQRQCAEYAIQVPPLHGIWGGMTPGERAEARKRKEA